MARIIRCQHIGGGSLPFYILLIVDNSGSLTSEKVPNVFTALDAIKAELVSLGNLTPSQSDVFIVVDESEENERYLDWWSTKATEYSFPSSREFLIITFQDEANVSYHDKNGFNSEANYSDDLIAFSSFISSNTPVLIGAKIFVPQDKISLGGGNNSGPSTPVIGVPDGFDIHLESVFNTPSSEGYPSPALYSFGSSLSFEIDETLNELECLTTINQSFIVGQVIWFDTAVSVDLTEKTPYFIVAANGTRIQISDTRSGIAVNFSTSTTESATLSTLDYEFLEDRNSASFSEEYVYNKMAEYINIYLGQRNFDLLTLR